MKVLWLWDNPICQLPNYRQYIVKILPNLTKLDNANVTNEEKQTLQIPARDQRAAFNEGAGYDLPALQHSLGIFDPNTFKRFQQSHCHDPVAVRVLSLHRLVAAEKGPTNPRRGKAELEAHAADKDGASTADKTRGREIKERPR